jgi:hypothetical protein
MDIRVDWLPVLKRMLSDVPVPLVLSSVSVDDAVVPPMTVGTTMDEPNVVSPVTVKLLPMVTLPRLSLTMLFVVPEGWMTLMVLRVEMAASY